MKNGSRVPIWLRRLSRVKMELQGIRWPSAKDGFDQGLALMAWGLEALAEEKKIGEKLASYAKADSRWISRWRKERARIFSV